MRGIKILIKNLFFQKRTQIEMVSAQVMFRALAKGFMAVLTVAAVVCTVNLSFYSLCGCCCSGSPSFCLYFQVLFVDLKNAQDMSLSLTALRIDLSSEELSLQASTLSDGSLMFSDLQLKDASCAVVLASNETDDYVLGNVIVSQNEMIGSENTMSTFSVEWTAAGEQARDVLLTALQESSASSTVQVDCAAAVLINVAGMVSTSYDTEISTTLSLGDFMSDPMSISGSDSEPFVKYGILNSTLLSEKLII